MAIRAKALFAQESLGLQGSSYVNLTFKQGEIIFLVSGSIENSYTVFGFTEANLRDQRSNQVDARMIETTILAPLYD